MRYGKIDNGTLKRFTKHYIATDNGGVIINPSEAHLRANGWLPIEQTIPEEREGYYPVCSWVVKGRGSNKHIESEWSYEPIPADAEEGANNG